MTDGGGRRRGRGSSASSVSLEPDVVGTARALESLGIPANGTKTSLVDVRRAAVAGLGGVDESTRIQDLVNDALRYTEAYKSATTRLQVYMDYCRAFELLFDMIPRHRGYEAFLSKTKSPFLEVFLDLCSVVANEDARALEDKLSAELRGAMDLDTGTKGLGASPATVVGPSKAVARRQVPRKPVGSPASRPSSPAPGLSREPPGSGPGTGASADQDDPLKARFAKLRSASKGSDEMVKPETDQNGYSAYDGLAHPAAPNGDVPRNLPPSPQINGKAKSHSPAPPPPSHPPPSPPKQTRELAYPRSTVIHAEALARYLELAGDSILVLDVRTRREFDRSHVPARNIVCIEPVSLRANMKDDDIEDGLVLAPEAEQNLFGRRDEFELVVYYDADSRTNSYRGGPAGDPQAMALYYLTSALYQRGFAKPLKRYPCLLVGGFEAWAEFTGEDYEAPARVPASSTESLSPAPPAVPDEMPSRPYGARKGSIPSSGSASAPAGYARDYADYLRSMPSLASGPVSVGPEPAQTIEDGRSRRRDSATAVYRGRQPGPTTVAAPATAPPHSGANGHANGAHSVVPNGYNTHQYYPQPPNGPMPGPTYPHHPGYPQHPGYPADPRYGPGPPSYGPGPGYGLGHPPHPAYASPIPSPQPLMVPSPINAYPPAGPPGHPASAPPAAQPPAVRAYDFTTGLRNLGNTCYMNCVLQCLAGTPAIAVPFVEGTFRRWINVNSRLGHKGILAHKFAELVQLMYREAYTYVPPAALKDVCGRIRDQFAGFEQQDCQEFLTFMLDGLHEDLNSNGDKERLKELTDEEEHRREQMTVRLASTIEWERYLKSNFSLIVDTTQGQLQSRLRCLSCGHTSTTYSAFSCLSLPIPAARGPRVTLQDCFNLFTAEEILDGDDAWRCPKCKTHRRSSKTLRIARLPSILIIHLKRFAQRGGRGYSTSNKLETFVSYPTTKLDLTPYWPKYTGPDEERKLSKLPVRGQTDPFVYNLYAVANHFGSLKGGHYTAFVKKSTKGWCYFDDTRVTRHQSDSAVVNSNAYVLFYERQKIVR